jgi:hypothetical protein
VCDRHPEGRDRRFAQDAVGEAAVFASCSNDLVPPAAAHPPPGLGIEPLPLVARRRERAAYDRDGLARFRAHRCRPRNAGWVQAAVLTQDRSLELPQRGSGLDAEFPDECLPGLPIDAEGLRLTARAVEREHQLRAEPLSARLLTNETFELDDEVVVTSARKVRIDSLLDRGETQLFEVRNLALRKRLVREVGKRRTAPERERLAEELRRRHGVAFGARTSGLCQPALEPSDIELVRLDPEEVARRPGLEYAIRAVADHARLERLSQPRHEHADDVGRGLGRNVAPQRIDESVARDDLVRVQQEDREQCALLPPAQRDGTTALARLDWPEDSEFHGCLLA